MILTLLRRFWTKVDRGAPDECWPWRGSTSNGYGQIACGDHGRTVPASHVALAIAGRFKTHPDDVALPTCGNQRCVNFAHLEWQSCAVRSARTDRSGTSTPPAQKGEKHPRAKLSDEKVRYIRTSPKTTLELEKELRVSNQCITRVRLRQTWKHVE